jgi:cation:H+ antiporter
VAQNLILLVVGLVGLTFAADRFVLGAAQVAARLQVSTVVTGALIIGFGTSAPELVVSTMAALTEGAEGTALAIGNIVGSNVANLTLVLALPALVYGPIAIEEGRGVKRQAAVSATGVTVFAAAVLLVHDELFEPTRWLGAGLALLTVIALGFVVWIGDRYGGVPPPDTTEGFGPWIWTVVGLAGTVAFAYLVVSSATSIADDLGWTGGFVGFGLVAVGTSLPELVTALAAARRGESGLIIGNLLGSNLFNSLTVGSAVFLANDRTPFNVAAGLPPWVLLGMVAVSWLVIRLMYTSSRIDRSEARVLILVYLAMLGYLAMTGATA